VQLGSLQAREAEPYAKLGVFSAAEASATAWAAVGIRREGPRSLAG
jgi:hypothetical protein